MEREESAHPCPYRDTMLPYSTVAQCACHTMRCGGQKHVQHAMRTGGAAKLFSVGAHDGRAAEEAGWRVLQDRAMLASSERQQ